MELVSRASWLLYESPDENCAELLQDSPGLDWCVYLFQPVAGPGSEVSKK